MSKDPIDDDEKNCSLFVSRVAALLDFYSDRATAHASLFVASIFGILTLLALVQNFNSNTLIFISIIAYFIFSYLGYHTLVRFGFYADIAQRLAVGLPQNPTMEKIGISKEEFQHEDPNLLRYLRHYEVIQQKILLIPKISHKYNRHWKYIICLIYWAMVTFVGCIVYFEKLALSDFIGLLSILLIFIVTAVILPFIRFKKSG